MTFFITAPAYLLATGVYSLVLKTTTSFLVVTVKSGKISNVMWFCVKYYYVMYLLNFLHILHIKKVITSQALVGAL